LVNRSETPGKADVEVPAALTIKRVQPTDRRVAFENADTLIVVGQPDPGGET